MSKRRFFYYFLRNYYRVSKANVSESAYYKKYAYHVINFTYQSTKLYNFFHKIAIPSVIKYHNDKLNPSILYLVQQYQLFYNLNLINI